MSSSILSQSPTFEAFEALFNLTRKMHPSSKEDKKVLNEWKLAVVKKILPFVDSAEKYKAIKSLDIPKSPELADDLEALRLTYDRGLTDVFKKLPERKLTEKPSARDYTRLLVDLRMIEPGQSVEHLDREGLTSFLERLGQKAKDLKAIGDSQLDELKQNHPDTLAEHLDKHPSSRDAVEAIINERIRYFISNELSLIPRDEVPYPDAELEKLLPSKDIYASKNDALIQSHLVSNQQLLHAHFYKAMMNNMVTHLINEGSFYDPTSSAKESKRNMLAENTQKQLLTLDEFSSYLPFINLQTVVNTMNTSALQAPEPLLDTSLLNARAQTSLLAVYKVAQELDCEEVLLDLLPEELVVTKSKYDLKK